MSSDPVFILAVLAFPVAWWMAAVGPELLVEWPLRVTVYKPAIRPVSMLEMAVYLACWDTGFISIWYGVVGSLPSWWIMLAMVLIHGYSALKIGRSNWKTNRHS